MGTSSAPTTDSRSIRSRPSTRTSRTTSSRDPSSTQVTTASSATMSRTMKAAFHGSERGAPPARPA
ncbi:hypothetical protein [Nocardiopsis halophila]|uniref:hypothetical protein n=1 Tax=Nocardiopsis halophila TaxID=141692 RepID=UPI00035F84FA|nr:hypothetical protein [Nocardiopsis halophila]